MIAASCTVFVVDDDAAVRTALVRLLRAEGYRVQAYACAQEFLQQHDSAARGCIVSDLEMPGLDGLDLQKAVAAISRPLPIVFLSGRGTVPSSVQAMKQGAVDFLIKPIDVLDLLAAVRRAIEQDLRARMQCDAVDEVRNRLASLTPREREVLAHVARGRLNKQVAADLGIVEKTIKVHRARVMEKMGARSLAELVRLCERAGIDAP